MSILPENLVEELTKDQRKIENDSNKIREAIFKAMKMRVDSMMSYLAAGNKKEIPMLFDFLRTDLGMVGFCPVLAGLPKEALPGFVNEFLKSIPCYAVLHTTEGYTFSKEDMKDFSHEKYKALMDIYGSIRNTPGSVEVFSVNASYKVKGEMFSSVYSYPIINAKDGTRSLNESAKDEIIDAKTGDCLFSYRPDLIIDIEG